MGADKGKAIDPILPDVPITNMQISELLARAGAEREGERARAYRRAARAAMMWPEEAALFVEGGGSLSDLTAIGKKLGGLISSWLEEPPEIPEPDPTRQGFMSFAHALRVLDGHPDWAEGLKGDLQMHSTYSDGKEPISAMAAEGLRRDYSYIAITDHSKGLPIAGGIDEARLDEQAVEIAEVNAQLDGELTVLRGMEMNLSPLGGGDMETEALKALDVVVGSFHSSLRKKEDQTDRYLAGVRNPTINILGHPRCRQYGFRLGLSADWAKVAKAAAKADTAIELNSHPNRQDLNPEIVAEIVSEGCLFSLGTDAHNTDEMRYAPIGLAGAIQAGIPKDRIVNFWDADRLLGWARSKRDAL